MRSFMDTTFATAEPSEMLPDVLGRLGACQCRSLLVLWQGRLVGLLAMDQVAELMSLRRRSVLPSEHDVMPGASSMTPWWRRAA